MGKENKPKLSPQVEEFLANKEKPYMGYTLTEFVCIVNAINVAITMTGYWHRQPEIHLIQRNKD